MDTPHRLPMTAVVVARNEADRIGRCIGSLVPLCAEVLVLDSGSTDDTVQIARQAGARVEFQHWLGFVGQKNLAISRSSHEWVLLLDADEWLGDGAAGVLAALFAGGRVDTRDAWTLVRRTHFLGAPLRHGGWGRESVQRLFRRRFRYAPALVHERLDLRGARIGDCGARIEHDTARNRDEYVAKLDRYAQLFAQQRHAEGKRANALSPASHALFYVLKNAILRGGFLDGPRGWQYHAAHTRYVWNKYRYLHDLPAAGPQH